MDPVTALTALFANPWLLEVSGASLVTSTVASLIHSALPGINAGLASAKDALVKIGFKVGDDVIASVVDRARDGVESVGDWLRDRLKSDVAVNEAAARTIAQNVDAASEALKNAAPKHRDAVATKMSEGLKSIGGAASVVSDAYAAAMADDQELAGAADRMRAAIDRWTRQTVEARHQSMIENVEQSQGRDVTAEQSIIADDHSTIRGVKQRVD
jgi:hypothetical protein